MIFIIIVILLLDIVLTSIMILINASIFMYENINFIALVAI